MKTIDEMCAVMQAYKEGKTIEYISPDDNDAWREIDNPHWDWCSLDYRVKPGHKYVPYDSVSEIDRGKWVRNKNHQHILKTISMVDSKNNRVYFEECHWFTLKEFFEIYEYEDGAPCGKVVEQ